MDFPIQFDRESKLPMYRQLAFALSQAIQSGRLKAGDPLPATRDIALSLGMARGTVVRAYNELLSQGYIEGKTGTGTTVSKNLPADMAAITQLHHPRPTETDSLSRFAHRLQSIPNVASTSADLPELNYGCAPQELLPVKQWRELLLSHCRPQEQPQLSYVSEPFGYRPLREAIAHYLIRAKAARCHADQVVIFSGPQQALNSIATILINEDDLVVVENPGYVGAREVFLAHGARLDAQAIDEDGLCCDGLNRLGKCKLVHVTPSGHDPSGVVMSADRRTQLLAFARRSGALILEDAWDTDYRYGGPAIPSLQGLSDGTSVIYLYTFWKVLFPLTTVSVAIVPYHLIPIFTRAKILMERQFPVLEYYALTDFVNDGLLETHIMKTRKIYQRRRQALLHALTTIFRSIILLPDRTAGLHLLAEFKVELAESDILDCAKQADLPMVSTRLYYLNSYARNEFLIPFASLTEETISSRVQRFADLIL